MKVRIFVGVVVCASAGLLGWWMHLPPAVAAQSMPAKAQAGPVPTAEQLVPADLNAAFSRALHLLETHDLVAIIKTVMPPEDWLNLQQQLQVATPEEAVALMHQRMPDLDQHAEETHQALLSVQGHAPEISLDGTHASYKVNPPIGQNKEITFVKINGEWYMR